MSIRDQIVRLEALDALDAELRRIDEQIAQEQGILSSLRGQLTKLDERLAKDRASLSEMDKLRGELIGELRQMASQIERSREKMSRSRNEREANASQREMEELRKLQRDRDVESQRLAELTDVARGSIETADAERTKVAAELAGCEADIAARLDTAGGERATKLGERTKIVASLPGSMVRRYDALRAKKGRALAKTINGTCLSCHMSLPPMLFQKLIRGEAFEQCPSCARILYYEAPAPPQDAG